MPVWCSDLGLKTQTLQPGVAKQVLKDSSLVLKDPGVESKSIRRGSMSAKQETKRLNVGSLRLNFESKRVDFGSLSAKQELKRVNVGTQRVKFKSKRVKIGNLSKTKTNGGLHLK